VDESQLAGLLAEFTGSLVSVESTPPGALDRTRRLLANALLTPQTEIVADATGPVAVTSLDDLPAATLEAIYGVVHDVVHALRDPSVRVFQRTWPLLTTHVRHSVPAWAAGWLPRESIGPFQPGGKQIYSPPSAAEP
jgi:hypothetical protein